MNRNGGILALVAGFLFAGYVLVYAAVANGGKLAAAPWDALRVDAYTGQPPAATATLGQKAWSWVKAQNPLAHLKHENIPPADLHSIVHRQVK